MEVDRAFVDLVEQQARDRRQPRFGVAHGRGAVAVAASRSCPGRRSAGSAGRSPAPCAPARRRPPVSPCGWKRPSTSPTTRALFTGLAPRRAAEAQAHALHRIQDAALHRLLAVAHVGQRAALDDAQRVFEVGALGVGRQGDGVRGVGRWGVEEVVHRGIEGLARKYPPPRRRPRVRLSTAARRTGRGC